MTLHLRTRPTQCSSCNLQPPADGTSAVIAAGEIEITSTRRIGRIHAADSDDPAAQSTTVATRLLPEGASPSLDIELRSALVESPRDRNLTRRCPDDPATVAATPLPQEVLVHSPTSPVSMPGFLRAALRWRCS